MSGLSDPPEQEAVSESAAWLWHDLALQHPVAAQPAFADLQAEVDAAVLGVLRTGDAAAATRLSELCLGVSEDAPELLPRAFWQLAAGMFECLAWQPSPLELGHKRLVSQVLRQFTAYCKRPEAASIQTSLAHEVLVYCLAAQPDRGGVLQAIHAAYGQQPLPAITLSLPDDDDLDEQMLDMIEAFPQSAELIDLNWNEPAHTQELEPEPVVLEPLALRDGPVPPDLQPMVLGQALQWSAELHQELLAWAPKPSRPLAPAVGVLAQVLQELLSSAGLHALATPVASLSGALNRARRMIAVFPMQAEVLVNAAQHIHALMQTLAAGGSPDVDDGVTTALDNWPPALSPTADPVPQDQAQDQDQDQAQDQDQDQAQDLGPDEPVQASRQDEPRPKPLSSSVLGTDQPRLLYVRSIAPRLHKAFRQAVPEAGLEIFGDDLALPRPVLQTLAAWLDVALPGVAHSAGEVEGGQALRLQLHLWPQATQVRVAVQASHTLRPEGLVRALEEGRALGEAVLEGPTLRLTLPATHVLCTVRLLQAGDVKFAVPVQGCPDVSEPQAWQFTGRSPALTLRGVLGEQEVVLQAPSPVMRRVPGVVGVLPKLPGESGLPVLVYDADMLVPASNSKAAP